MPGLPRVHRMILPAIFALVTGLMLAQGPPGHDPYNPSPGHGGVPPGQAKKQGSDERRLPPGQAKKYDEDRRLPPGQAKKIFRDQDRASFYAHYRRDADGWKGRRRPVFVPGQIIQRTYYVQPVPRTYWVGVAPPPPPGYQYGYYEGYVVAYDPTTRLVADVLDLVSAFSGR